MTTTENSKWTAEDSRALREALQLIERPTANERRVLRLAIQMIQRPTPRQRAELEDLKRRATRDRAGLERFRLMVGALEDLTRRAADPTDPYSAPLPA